MATLPALRLFAAALALAGSATAQPKVEITSRLGTKFSSLPDDKGAVAAAEKNLGSDVKNPDSPLFTSAIQTASGVASRHNRDQSAISGGLNNRSFFSF